MNVRTLEIQVRLGPNTYVVNQINVHKITFICTLQLQMKLRNARKDTKAVTSLVRITIMHYVRLKNTLSLFSCFTKIKL